MERKKTRWGKKYGKLDYEKRKESQKKKIWTKLKEKTEKYLKSKKKPRWKKMERILEEVREK